MSIRPEEILETIGMIEVSHFDIRTVTMGISLRDCSGNSVGEIADKVYKKIVMKANSLVKTAREVEVKYGIPIINKRISVTPVSIFAESAKEHDYTEIARAMDRAAKDVGVNFIGGFTALVHKGATPGDDSLMESIPVALSQTERVCGSVNLASTKCGINLDAVYKMSKIIKELARLTKDQGSIGCAKLVVFANVPEDNPFMAGAFHGIGEPDCIINVGISGPGVVLSAVEAAPDADMTELSNIIKKTAFKITRMGEMAGQEVSRMLGIPFGIVDISLAPTPAPGDSVAEILEKMGLEKCGTHGTTCCLAMLNDAVKKGGVMATSHVGGLSGAFIPVSEDANMIAAVRAGALSLDKLEAMTCVCSVGLDMVAVPGDTPDETIAAIIADEMAIGVINNKTTAVRIIPVYGKNVGESVSFGGLLGEAPIMPVNKFSSYKFIKRGGRVPAPIQSLTN
ncbi:MAG: PFL family protein [Candidatus Wallbacteria bacterium]|nr:PFL family protein [Candidatus Wallbacteria bacterium]